MASHSIHDRLLPMEAAVSTAMEATVVAVEDMPAVGVGEEDADAWCYVTIGVIPPVVVTAVVNNASSQYEGNGNEKK